MQNRTRINKYTYYLKKQRVKNSIAVNLKCLYVDMHVDDFLDMAKRHGYIKDDSDLNENTFISVMQGLDVTYEKSGAVKMLHHVAHRLSLRNLLKNV